jgi:acetyl-CoA carboxylase biotin carboxyl carrier protein
LELKEIKAIIDLMKKNDLAVFKLEREGFKLELEAHRHTPQVTAAVPVHHVVTTSGPAVVTGAPVETGTSHPSGPAEDKTIYQEIVSPMVGTFYRAPSPESAPYVEVGQSVAEDTVVCIIEAMKVMNEIRAEIKGVIVEILVENGTAVQFGQPLFRLK